MAFFGIGTIPMLFGVSVLGGLIPAQKINFQRFFPIITATVAVILILRGLSLGIPYISPVMEMTPAGEVTSSCCTPQ